MSVFSKPPKADQARRALEAEFKRRFPTPARRRAAIVVMQALANADGGLTEAQLDAILREKLSHEEMAEIDALPLEERP